MCLGNVSVLLYPWKVLCVAVASYVCHYNAFNNPVFLHYMNLHSGEVNRLFRKAHKEE